MAKINLQLDFDAIRKRIDRAKEGIKPSVWADMVGVTRNIVTNVHGKTRQKPSLEYIVAVSKATGRSVDYYLWGEESTTPTDTAYQDQTTQQIISEHIQIIKKFKDPKQGKDANECLIELQDSDPALYDRAIDTLVKLRDAARVLKDLPSGNSSAPSSGSNETKNRLKKPRLPKGAEKNGTTG